MPVSTKFWWWWRAGEILLLIALAAAAVLAYGRVLNSRQKVELLKAAVEQAPERVAQQEKLKAELALYDTSIRGASALAPAEAEMPVILDWIERTSARYGVKTQVPGITEEVKRDDNGKAIPWTGPLKEVRLLVLATGEPVQLLRLLDGLEQMPFLLRVKAWRIKAEAETGGNLALVAPAAPGEEALPLKPLGSLEVTLILSLRNYGN